MSNIILFYISYYCNCPYKFKFAVSLMPENINYKKTLLPPSGLETICRYKKSSAIGHRFEEII